MTTVKLAVGCDVLSGFADVLNSAMDEAHLTAAELAESAGLTESAISLPAGRPPRTNLSNAAAAVAVLPALAGELEARPNPFDAIEDAIDDIRAGKMVVVLDDEDRENEGDLVMAAEKVTPEAINFMRKEAGGLICVPMLGSRLDELQIPQMVRDNTAVHETAFTVSVEARGRTTTGISAHDRAATIKKLLDPDAEAADFLRPGHTFPLRAREGGVLVRAGQTEASVDLARLAGLYPAGVICEIMAEDGTMERLAGLRDYADRHRSASHHRQGPHRLPHAHRKTRQTRRRIQTSDHHRRVGSGVAYETTIDGNTHVALTMGDVSTARTCSCASTPSASPATRCTRFAAIARRNATVPWR